MCLSHTFWALIAQRTLSVRPTVCRPPLRAADSLQCSVQAGSAELAARPVGRSAQTGGGPLSAWPCALRLHLKAWQTRPSDRWL